MIPSIYQRARAGRSIPGKPVNLMYNQACRIMATHPSKTRDETPGEEVASTTIPPTKKGTPPPQRNACTPSSLPSSLSFTDMNTVTDLMSPHKKRRTSSPPKSRTKTPHSSTPSTDPARNTTFLGRDGLGAYIASPSSFPASRVIYHDDKWVVINDLFPKSSVHILLLPREPAKQLLHPYEAFEDLEFLQGVQDEVKKLRALVAKELHRRFGKYSAQDQAHQRALDASETSPSASDTTPTSPSQQTLPPLRDWSTSITAGIHAGPSMNHLHIHILSSDRHSECMKHRKHYNSFSTPFFVNMDEFPIKKGDSRRRAAREGNLDRELKCWRCGRGFGNKFARLKEHLEEEFLVWRAE